MIKVILFTELNSVHGYVFLNEIIKSNAFQVSAIVTREDHIKCPYFYEKDINVKKHAEKLMIPVLQPEKVNSDKTVSQLEDYNADYFFVVNYQLKLSQKLVAIPGRISINFHPSKLPEYAGFSPFFWMAKFSERKSGVTAITLDEQLDAGDIICQRDLILTGEESSLEILYRHIDESIHLLHDVMGKIVSNAIELTPQTLRDRSYFGQPKWYDYSVNWYDSCEDVVKFVEKSYYYPGAGAITLRGETVFILKCEQTNYHFAHSVLPGCALTFDGCSYIKCADGFVKLTLIRHEDKIFDNNFYDLIEDGFALNFDIAQGKNILADNLYQRKIDTNIFIAKMIATCQRSLSAMVWKNSLLERQK